MEIRFNREIESKLQELADKTGRKLDEVVCDVVTGYLQEVSELRDMLDSRYDDIKSGRVKPVNGEEFFEDLRRREEILAKQVPGK